jgi:hypothetical protein
MRPLTRITPGLPASAYKTYQILSPLSTHYRDGSCDEAGCLALRHGWQTSVDEATELGQRQAHYIRRLSGRRFAERRTELGLTAFTFEPGQKCFAAHKVSLARPEIFVVKGGDWRGNPRGDRRIHSSADSWVDDFGTHQDRLARALGQ